MAKLMLVEDDNNLREIYGARLQAEGYQIVSAKDGEEALVLAKAEKPDLIISDIMMPKISGFEMLDILRNTDELKTVKVIMLTALGQDDDQQRANSLGADRYLVKSQVTLEDIVKVTHELLGDEVPATPDQAAAAPPAPAPTAPAPPTPVAPAPPAASTPPPPSAAPATPTAPIAPTLATAPPVVPAPEPSTAVVETAPVTPPAAPAAAAIPVVEEPAVPATAPELVPPVPSEPPAATDSPPPPVTPAAPDDTPAATPPEPLTASDTATTDTASEETKADAAAADKSAQSTAQEEAGVESRIEDFVSGASEEATPPSAATAASADDTTADPVTEPTADEAADTASDDKLVADAAQALIDSTEPDKKDAQTETIIEPTESPKPPEKPKPESTSSSVPIAHKKVIKPLDDEPKQDLEELLAIEAAKEADAKAATEAANKPLPIVVNGEPSQKPDASSSTPSLTPPPPATGSTIVPTGPPEEDIPAPENAPLPNDPADPGSIAL
jgi:CheY-like chemotaxis protein